MKKYIFLTLLALFLGILTFLSDLDIEVSIFFVLIAILFLLICIVRIFYDFKHFRYNLGKIELNSVFKINPNVRLNTWWFVLLLFYTAYIVDEYVFNFEDRIMFFLILSILLVSSIRKFLITRLEK